MQQAELRQPESDLTPRGNLKVWIWQLQHWEEVFGMTNPGQVAIPNLEADIESCLASGIDIQKETGMTVDDIKNLAERTREEWRKTKTAAGLIK